MNEWELMEEDLRQELRHVPAPEGFADRVLARAAGDGRRQSVVARAVETRAGWWAAAAALLLAAGAEGMHLHHMREAKHAEAQLTLAMALTNHALQAVQRDVDRSPAGRYTRILQDDAREGEGR